MDPKKPSAVPTDLILKVLNYYHQLIPHFCTLISPITTLTKNCRNTKDWTPQAEEAYCQLKKAFASASVFHYPDASRAFNLEIDVSSLGIWSVLNKKRNQSNNKGRILTCGFLSKTFPLQREITVLGTICWTELGIQ